MSAPRDTTNGTAERVLTARQLEVLTLVALGRSTDGIARELFLTPNTIRKHVRHILDRLCAHNRPHAVAIAISAGLISIDDYAVPGPSGRAPATRAMVTVAGGLGGHDGIFVGAAAAAPTTRPSPGQG